MNLPSELLSQSQNYSTGAVSSTDTLQEINDRIILHFCVDVGLKLVLACSLHVCDSYPFSIDTVVPKPSLARSTHKKVVLGSPQRPLKLQTKNR